MAVFTVLTLAEKATIFYTNIYHNQIVHLLTQQFWKLFDW